MLIETGILQQFNQIPKTTLRGTGVPFKWVEGHLQVNRRTFLTSTLVVGVGGLAHFQRVIQSFLDSRAGKETFDPNISGIVVIVGVGFIYFANISLTIYRDPGLLEGFLTQMVRFERNYVQTQRLCWRTKEKGRLANKVALLTCQVMNVATLRVVPPLFAGICMIVPGILFNVGGIEQSPFGGGWVAWLGHRLGLFVWNRWNWYFAVRMWTLLANFLVLGCRGLVTAILAFERTFETEPVKEGVVIYRQIQLLGDSLNRFVSRQLVLLLAIAGSLQIFSGRTLLAPDGLPLYISMKLFLAMAILNGVIAVIFIFGFCGEVHDTSEKCGRRIKSRLGGQTFIPTRRMREMRRVIPSLPSIKVRFGTVNFIEKVTPVMFQQFVTMRLVDCLLVDGSR